MARATGASAQLLLKKESTYGTAPSGNYFRMPFIGCSLGLNQGLIDDPVIGRGRDPRTPFRDVKTVDGDATVPVDMRYLGLWLTALFGTPTSTDETTHHQHVWASGANTLPSYSIEVGHPNIPAYFLNKGVCGGTLGLNFERSGAAQAVIGLTGQDEAKNTSSQGGTPVDLSYTRVSQFQGSIKRNGTAFSNVVSAGLNFSNNLDPVNVIRSDGLIGGIDPTLSELTGSVTARFDSTQLYDDAVNDTELSLEFAYTISATSKLVILANNVRMPIVKQSVDGPAGIEATFDWRAAYDESDTYMLSVTLLNDLDGTQYT